MKNLFAIVNTRKIPLGTINDVNIQRSGNIRYRHVTGEAVNEEDRNEIKKILEVSEGEFIEYDFQDEHGQDHGSARVDEILLKEDKLEGLIRIKYRLQITKV